MAGRFSLSEFDFPLPHTQLAHRPAQPRDSARLLVVTPDLVDQHIRDLPNWLRRGDVLVVNTTKVFPARLLGQRMSGGKVELLLLRPEKSGVWICLGKGLPPVNSQITFSPRLKAQVIQRQSDDTWTVRFSLTGKTFWQEVERIGHTPLPPYLKNIAETAGIRRAYQTVFAHQRGSAAAPTAGLHFTPRLLARLRAKGVVIVPVILHVGWGTFAPIRETDIRQHQMHAEWGEISAASWKKLLTVTRLQKLKKNKKAPHQKSAAQIFAVGTTALRVVEAAARDKKHRTGRWSGWISLYLKPGDKLKMVNGLLTNFHLPKTTLFVLVSSILGTWQAQTVYATARERGYRWASFGDAMLILPERGQINTRVIIG